VTEQHDRDRNAADDHQWTSVLRTSRHAAGTAMVCSLV
jgi:hypothetical protein